jgi:hypothetical protein
LIDTGRADLLVWGFLGGAGLMFLAADTELLIGVPSERQPLEPVPAPLTGPAASPREQLSRFGAMVEGCC